MSPPASAESSTTTTVCEEDTESPREEVHILYIYSLIPAYVGIFSHARAEMICGCVQHGSISAVNAEIGFMIKAQITDQATSTERQTLVVLLNRENTDHLHYTK